MNPKVNKTQSPANTLYFIGKNFVGHVERFFVAQNPDDYIYSWACLLPVIGNTEGWTHSREEAEEFVEDRIDTWLKLAGLS